MVGKKFHALHFNVVFEPVDLDAILVIYVGILFLCGSKKGVVVQPAHISDSFADLNLARQFATLPVECSKVTFSSTKQEMSTITCVIASVGTKADLVFTAKLELE